MLDKKLQFTWRQVGWRLIASVAVFALGFALLGIFAPSVGAAALQQDSPSADPTVNVAHFAPFGDSQEGTSVSVFVDDAEAIPNFEFGDVENNVSLSPGEHLIEIKPTGSSTVAISATVDLAEDGMYTVIATGDGVNQPLALKVLDDATSTPADGSAKLRVGHLAPFAADLGDTAVDICLADGTPIAPLQGVTFDTVSDFLELPVGDYDFIVTIAGSNCETVALDIPSIRLSNGDIADAYAIGMNNETFPLKPATILGLTFTPAMVNVAHFAPFGDSQDGTSVSVFVDDAEAIPNFEFGDVENNVSLSPGEHLIEIKPTGSSTVAISATVDLAEDGMYTVIATGDGVNQPLALKVLDDSTSTPADGSAKLRVGHLAPFAADLGATAVDICLADGTPIAPLQSVTFDIVSDFLELPVGDYDFIVTIAGSNCETVALDIPSIRLSNGDIADAYAIGMNNETFPLKPATILGLTFTPAMVNVAHFAPFGDSQDGTSVSVFVDDAEAIPNFEFGDVENNVSLSPGEHLIEIKPTGSSTVAISATVDLDIAGMYTVIATGDGVNQPLALKVLDDSTSTPADGFAKLRVGHLAPFAADLGSTAVDICLADGTPIAPLQGVTFDIVSDFLELEAGDYDFIITIAGSNCESVALDIPSIRLSSGDIADAYAIGMNNETFPLKPATVLGLTFTPTNHYFPFAAK